MLAVLTLAFNRLEVRLVVVLILAALATFRVRMDRVGTRVWRSYTRAMAWCSTNVPSVVHSAKVALPPGPS